MAAAQAEDQSFWRRRRAEIVDRVQLAMLQREEIRRNFSLGIATPKEVLDATALVEELDELLREFDAEHPDARSLPR